jgi:hypothetical protein
LLGVGWWPGTSKLLDSHWEFLDRLLELGADPNTRDNRGGVPLHATIPFFPELADRLLGHGADPSFENGRDQSAIDYAHDYLTDQAGLLSDAQKQALEALLEKMRRTAVSQAARGAPARPSRDRQLAQHPAEARYLEANPKAKAAYLEVLAREEAHTKMVEEQRKRVDAYRREREQRADPAEPAD